MINIYIGYILIDFPNLIKSRKYNSFFCFPWRTRLRSFGWCWLPMHHHLLHLISFVGIVSLPGTSFLCGTSWFCPVSQHWLDVRVVKQADFSAGWWYQQMLVKARKDALVLLRLPFFLGELHPSNLMVSPPVPLSFQRMIVCNKFAFVSTLFF